MEGAKENLQVVGKFCLDNGNTKSVANLNIFPTENYQEFPLNADCYVLCPIRKVIKMNLKAKVGGVIAQAYNQLICLVEEPKQMTSF